MVEALVEHEVGQGTEQLSMVLTNHCTGILLTWGMANPSKFF